MQKQQIVIVLAGFRGEPGGTMVRYESNLMMVIIDVLEWLMNHWW
jgi:hypothetical protein